MKGQIKTINILQEASDNKVMSKTVKMRIGSIQDGFQNIDKNSVSIKKSQSQNHNMILSIGNYGSNNMILEMKMNKFSSNEFDEQIEIFDEEDEENKKFNED